MIIKPHKEVLTQLREDKKTYKEIVAFTGLTRGQVCYYLKKYNLTKTRGLPYVARNRTAGGTLVIRIPKELHKQLADLCESTNQSINTFVTHLIQEAVDS